MKKKEKKKKAAIKVKLWLLFLNSMTWVQLRSNNLTAGGLKKSRDGWEPWVRGAQVFFQNPNVSQFKVEMELKDIKTQTAVTLSNNTGEKYDVHVYWETQRDWVKQAPCEQKEESAKKKENINKLALEKYNNLPLFALLE